MIQVSAESVSLLHLQNEVNQIQSVLSQSRESQSGSDAPSDEVPVVEDLPDFPRVNTMDLSDPELDMSEDSGSD